MNDEAAPREKTTIVHLKDKELVGRVCRQARDDVLTWLQERKHFSFQWANVNESFSPYHFGRFLGFGRNDKLDFNSVAKVLARHSPMKFRTFEVTWSGGDESNPCVSASVKDQSAWTDVLSEAWEGLQRPSSGLPPVGGRLTPGAASTG